MRADHKVSVAWQMVFTLLPIVNFWAFYRIRKLRRYVLYIIVPEIILGAYYGAYITFSVFSDQSLASRASSFTFIYTDPVGIAINVIGYALTGFAIYLVIIWSRKHNRRYDQPTAQTTGP